MTVVAPAWKSSLESTARVAEQLLPSGRVLWGLDETEEIFSAYGVGAQPAGAVVSAGGELLDSWPGARDSQAIREILDSLLGDT